MAILLIETTGSTASNNIVSAVGAGLLWGVSMGTTSKAACYSDRALIECSKSRADLLLINCPNEEAVSVYDGDPASFAASDEKCQIWFLRGKLE